MTKKINSVSPMVASDNCIRTKSGSFTGPCDSRLKGRFSLWRDNLWQEGAKRLDEVKHSERTHVTIRVHEGYTRWTTPTHESEVSSVCPVHAAGFVFSFAGTHRNDPRAATS